MGIYYYVNTKVKLSRVYLLHTAQCPLLPPLEERLFLGTFYAPRDALKQAKKYYPQTEGCEICCPQLVKKGHAQSHQLSNDPSVPR